ncbi:alpha/beta fold hydrolase, partial [Streptomyces sp. NPDC058297]|uniref:alpha/beta fold hydrolase n=1 Tax=Streptomyces sp. NPDC058297 TaxID=3346433 RepID=UPI0036EC2EB4
TNEEAADAYASAGAFDPDAARAALTGWDARVLVLAGERDGGPLPRVAAAMAELLPHAELVVQEGAGHFPWVDDPQRFTKTVASFLG